MVWLGGRWRTRVAGVSWLTQGFYIGQLISGCFGGCNRVYVNEYIIKPHKRFIEIK